jgi:serine/threonine protein phosphatase PrpC
MEDAHITKKLTNGKNFLSAVFDGHGGTVLNNLGAEVSTYVERYFIKEL